MKNPALFLALILMLSGCATAVKYEPRSDARPAKPKGYPTFVYMEDTKIPRPARVIGTIKVGSSGSLMVGASPEKVMATVMENAWKRGADVVRVTAMLTPDFMNSNYRMTADLLCYTDAWETIAMPEHEFLAYLKQNERTLDPIEGVWTEQGQNQYLIGIMKNTSKSGRDFVAFVLHTRFPPWQKGYKKIDIARGTQRNTYVFDYYLDDFNRQETTVILGGARGFTLAVQTEGGSGLITFSKNLLIPANPAGPPVR